MSLIRSRWSVWRHCEGGCSWLQVEWHSTRQGIESPTAGPPVRSPWPVRWFRSYQKVHVSIHTHIKYQPNGREYIRDVLTPRSESSRCLRWYTWKYCPARSAQTSLLFSWPALLSCTLLICCLQTPRHPVVLISISNITDFVKLSSGCVSITWDIFTLLTTRQSLRTSLWKRAAPALLTVIPVYWYIDVSLSYQCMCG